MMNIPNTYILMLIDHRFYNKFEQYINSYCGTNDACENLVRSILIKRDNIAISIVANFVYNKKASIKCHYLIADYVIKNNNQPLINHLLTMISYFTPITDLAIQYSRYDLVKLVAMKRAELNQTNNPKSASIDQIDSQIKNSILHECYEEIAYGLHMPGMSQEIFDQNAVNWIKYTNENGNNSIITSIILNTNWNINNTIEQLLEYKASL